MTTPAARSLVLDLLSTLRGGTMPVSALVAAGALFGIAENSVRVAVARLLAAGQVERDERGRYRLGERAHAVDRRVHGWRKLEERTRSWDGEWIGIHMGELPTPRRRALRLRERALRLLGFQVLSSGLAIRPDNLRGGMGELRRELHSLGLETGAVSFRLRELEPSTEARARGLWDVATLCDGYRRSFLDLETSAEELPKLPEAQAMVESYLLGGRVIRQLVLDPLLPEPIVPAAERRALVAALRRYDEAGRRIWAPFMARHGAPHTHTPADTHAPDRLELH